MTLYVTDAHHVALVDPVSGLAFGETFDSEEEARDFARWLGLVDARRVYTGWPRRSISLRDQWARERGPTTADVAEARRTGICTVCGETGYAPWELDDSGRCDRCRP